MLDTQFTNNWADRCDGTHNSLDQLLFKKNKNLRVNATSAQLYESRMGAKYLALLILITNYY
jgi:hypothetical protein